MGTLGSKILKTSATISTTSQFGIVWSFREEDPNCGPGLYQLTRLQMPLRLSFVDQPRVQSVLVTLYLLDDDGPVLPFLSISSAVTQSIPLPSSPPTVVSIALPQIFQVSSAKYPQGTKFMITFKTSYPLQWFNTSALDPDAPVGFGINSFGAFTYLV